ncbi:hypothetical protein PR048_000772 [Dryococelus australis]|uniref:Uncharacterized protein n=1 Tax=Dryococelus australis TaxID=614101 RepID=A0ABQ9IFJ6_9NEOP|nr:hypothetical protein PR048_000772 [Dryococelus australis]
MSLVFCCVYKHCILPCVLCDCRFRLISLLKKLSPRPRRFSNKVLKAQNVFPWVVVEFSNKDLGSKNEQPGTHDAGRCNSEDSNASDKSFAMTVRINKLRKQQVLEKV